MAPSDSRESVGATANMTIELRSCLDFKSLFTAVTVLFLTTWANTVQAQVELQYQRRGNRYEGIKAKPVSGYDIELISARVDYQEAFSQLPASLKVKFFLERVSEVHLTVRELDYKYFYWMDRVEPSMPWQAGFVNGFEWPTRDVVQQLEGIGMYALGVLARLEKSEPGKVERVAPVILYHSRPPETINGYLFTLKTNGDVRLTCSVYSEGKADPVFTSSFPRQRGSRPFTVRWDSSQAKEGSYRLVVKGFLLDTNEPVDQVVRFFHRPIVK